MGLLDLFKQKKVELSDKQLKRGKLWELWEVDKVQSPYAELMTYQSEINNGGHAQYFFNLSSICDLQKEMATLETILPSQLKETLKTAYSAFLALEESDDKKAEEILEQCDNTFYENEKEINRILEEYADAIEL
ncbi:MAG: DUF4375 domain-containing protein [Candidatus Coproplasma sp.]